MTVERRRVRALSIGWHGSAGRALELALALGIELHAFPLNGKGKGWRAADRYVRMAFRTIATLRSERPEVVVVTNPPIIAVAVVYLYQRLSGRRFVIDSHSGAFVDPRWSRFLPLHRWLSARADLTIVHNAEQAELVDSWGVKWIDQGYVPIAPPGRGVPALEGPYMLAVCSGGEDEGIDEIAAAARLLPDVTILMTGPVDRIRTRLTDEPPANLRLLGYVSFEQYLGYLHGASGVLTLTGRAATLLNGGFEAIAYRRPLVTSDTETLRNYLTLGTIHTSKDASSIAAAITDCLARTGELEAEMKELADRCDAEWARQAPLILGPGSVGEAHRPGECRQAETRDSHS